MSDNNDLGAFLAGFVIGGLVGAATAIILAPQSGEETRHQLVDKSRQLRDVGGERAEHWRQAAGSYTESYRGRAEQLWEQTRDRVQEPGAGADIHDQERLVLDPGTTGESSGVTSETLNGNGEEKDASA